MNPKLFNHLNFGQEHLLTFWKTLNESEQNILAAQIESIDFALIAELYKRRNEPAESLTLADRANDPPAYKFSTVTDPTPCKTSKPITVSEAVEAGTEALRTGKVAFARHASPSYALSISNGTPLQRTVGTSAINSCPSGSSVAEPGDN